MEKDIFSLKDKVAVVTGGTGHLGSVIAKNLIDYGTRVASVDIVEKKAEQIIEIPENRKRFHMLMCDLSSTGSIRNMFRKVGESLGKIDILVNCAAYGGGSGNRSSVYNEFADDDVWNRGIDGTLNVTYRCIREAFQWMNKNSSIINIASMYGVVSPDPDIYGDTGFDSPPMYGAGKAGIIQLTRYYAANFAKYGIRVNAVTPGPFPGGSVLENQDFMERLISKTMMKRTGKPEELAGVIILLASNASSFMTGSNIVVDGGWTAW